ncbi:MAG TPA: MATE family efflux transporter [Rhizomicrobium sp.]|nr:MATE family efflux transporter [Rhizomicrobium sp.]
MSDIAELEFVDAGELVQGHGLDAWIAESGELMKLAGPLIVTQLAQMAIMTTDVLMLGHIGKTALAGAALGNTMFFFGWLVGTGPGAAVSPMIAHILGASPNNRAGVRAVTRMGLWSVLIMSLPLIVLMTFTRQILVALGQSQELATAAALFVRPLSFGLPFTLGFQVLRNYSTALSKPNASLIVMLVSIGFNALGDYALIFGHFGFPRLGLTGSGTASACSLAFSFVAMLVVVRLTPKLHQFRVFRRFHRPDWTKLVELYRLGMPIGMTMIFEAMLFNSATLIMGTFGTATVAAHQISLNVPSITFMVPLGVAMAATVRVGLAAGAGDREAVRRAGWSAIFIATSFMVVCALLIWNFPRQIAEFYFGADLRANADAIALTIVFLHVAAAFQVVDGMQVSAALALRGLKDARAPMWIAGGSYWIAGAPMGLWLAFGEHLKGLGIWIGLAFGLLVAAAAMSARFWFLSRDA